MMKTVRCAVCLGVLLAALVARVDAAGAAQRVLLIGDETVVDSAVEPYGFTNELRKVMADEGRDVEFVPLGKRDATFADWRALIADSREKNEPTDVDGVFVKDELDKGADVVVLFLGINDALKPSFRGFDWRLYFLTGNHLATLSSAARQWANRVGEPFRNDVSGLVDDLKKRLPGCRVVVADLYAENHFYWGSSALSFVRNQIGLATQGECDRIVNDQIFRDAVDAARFSDEEIRLAKDGFPFNEYGSQLMAWATLLALDPDRTFSDASKRARSAYWDDVAEKVAPNPPFDEWEEIARRYYENRVDRRLRDFRSPGFTLSAEFRPFSEDDEGAVDKYYIELRCFTRGIKADQPLKNPDGYGVDPGQFRVSQTPKIEIVACGNLQFSGYDRYHTMEFSAPNGVKRGNYHLIFYGKPEDFPAEIAIAIGSVRKSVRFFPSGKCAVSGGFPLEKEFSGLDDFPEEKAITSVDYAALAGHNPATWRRQEDGAGGMRPSMGVIDRWLYFPRDDSDGSYKFEALNPADVWQNATSISSPLASCPYDGPDPDPNWFNLASNTTNTPFAGAYVVRVFESPKDQEATLKLGVGGRKTHVVERVYINGKSVFFGELDVDDPEKREVAVPTRVKEGRNILVARVDRTQWDWIVGFTLLDEEGRPLEDRLER